MKAIAADESAKLTILVADDNAVDKLILETLLTHEGHTVIAASNGREAVNLYRQHLPEMVLLDVVMPELDGFDVAREIKAHAGESLVPIIFLTSLSDTASLVKCLDAGGDDFLSKPYNRIILKAKIKSFNRMRQMHAMTITQRNTIAKHHAAILQEQIVAKQVFDNIAHSGCLNADNVKYYLSSLAVFNGDILVAALTPNGNMMILLGDFTGHGLPAAMGAIPLASIFYGMVHKGYSLSAILREINLKLKATLPLGIFCCAIGIEIQFEKRSITVWNGGLPDALIYRISEQTVERVKSTHLPLGLLSDHQFDTRCYYYPLAMGDRFLMATDGIHEARNQAGEMFGEDRLLDIFRHSDQPEKRFEQILSAVNQFTLGTEKDDDLALIEVTMRSPTNLEAEPLINPEVQPSTPVNWHFNYEVDAASLSHFDPLPVLFRLVSEVSGLNRYQGRLQTVLAELYSNALEHGILGLDSALKDTPGGFHQYYKERDERLANLRYGFIKFDLEQRKLQAGHSELVVTVSNSGTGFDPALVAEQGARCRYRGRGFQLLNEICDSVRVLDEGRTVVTRFFWS